MYKLYYSGVAPLIRLAQLVERQSHELVVVGSNPTTDTRILTRLAQSVERQPFKLVAVGSSPTLGAILWLIYF